MKRSVSQAINGVTPGDLNESRSSGPPSWTPGALGTLDTPYIHLCLEDSVGCASLVLYSAGLDLIWAGFYCCLLYLINKV